MEFAHLVQLFSEKSFQEILNSFDDDELLLAEPNFIPILFEVAICLADKRKCDLLFINSLNHIDSDTDISSSILCNALVYVFHPFTLQRQEKIIYLLLKLRQESAYLFNMDSNIWLQ